MSTSILRALTRELSHAFRVGKFSFVLFGKVFVIEHVNGREYRVTMSDGQDVGVRFIAVPGQQLSVFLA